MWVNRSWLQELAAHCSWRVCLRESHEKHIRPVKEIFWDILGWNISQSTALL